MVKIALVQFALMLHICLNAESWHTNILSNKDTLECLIQPSKGISGLVIDTSTISDVIKVFGKGEVRKYWKKCSENTFCVGRKAVVIQYDNLGIKIELYRANILFGKRRIKSIEITKKSQCKTLGGIGIGSSYEDVYRVFGKPDRFDKENYIDGKRITRITYYPKKSNVFFYLICSEWKTEKEFTIEKIEIY